ncbi:hypothetical protein PM082_014027 [Marasmius tenuissimus]|nr:hypothetical protein PM082_014027 [Marasmius tenuissimus]
MLCGISNAPEASSLVFIFITVLHIFAILSTIFRLARRIRIKKLSWDDGWVVVATFLFMTFVVLDWVNRALAIKRLGEESMLKQPEHGTSEVLVAALNFAAIWCVPS